MPVAGFVGYDVDSIAAILSSFGISDVVTGGKYVTWDVVGAFAKSRAGLHVIDSDPYKAECRLVLADSHASGSAPSGVVEAYAAGTSNALFPVAYIVGKDNTSFIVAGRRATGDPYYYATFFGHILDPATLSSIGYGIIPLETGGSNNGIATSDADTFVAAPVIIQSNPVVKNVDVAYVVPVFVAIGSLYGMLKDVYYAPSVSDSIQNVSKVTIGTDVYMKIGNYLVKV